MTIYTPQSLSNAVAAICPDIESRVLQSCIQYNDRRLWWELSSCILSSQVTYALATAFSDAIDAERILFRTHHDTEVLTKRLYGVLSTPRVVEGRLRSYRFPVARARHLAAARAIITAEKCSLRELVDSFRSVTEARVWMVKHIPGIGPKQASMFLRNIGVSYDLAILDRHVLNYMSKLGIYSGSSHFISGLSQYYRHEGALREHAKGMDCPVGLLDWAIWIVMRVASRNVESVAI